jgi:DNA N-6-adenine-methyltransferase (Dam)
MSTAAHRFDNDLRYRSEDHPQQTQLTPSYVLEPVREALDGIDLDPCTLESNPTGAQSFYYPPVDGAELPWGTGSIYVNPPYGKARERWVEKCILAAANGARVVLLIPAATDTRIFQCALSTSDGAVLIRGRVKFGVLRPNRRQVAASHPSALIGWNVDLDPCAHLGLCITTKGIGAVSGGPA